MQKKISVVIVTFNAMKWAEKCFTSLKNSSLPVQTIVVDNGSSDGTRDYISKYFPEVHLIANTENLGFGKANNVGIEYAYQSGADFFYLMNQDAWIYPETLQKIITFYNSYPQQSKIGILSPLQLDGTEKKIEIFVEKYLAHNALRERIFSDVFLANDQQAYEIDFVNAAHWFLPKDTIEIVGGFNPYFFHYGEDNEYVNRVKYKEKKLFFVKNCFAVHDGNQDLSKVDYTQYLDTTIETKILDPRYQNAEKQELISLNKSIVKNIATGNIHSAKKLVKIRNRIANNLVELRKLKEILKKDPHPFLKL